ncbi:Glycosyltransferase [hydrothermal vent metagenome]|uniref:Glycosyltransferase n=1 Tax=hydrothermal vent metagenome TaxID=652676 RepID=A0A3B0S0F2_9ZZZZ
MARKSEAAIWRAADMVLPVTHVLAAKLRAAGVADEKITVIQNGASEEFLSPHDGGAVRARYNIEGKLILGFSGFVRDWHGVDRVVRAIAKHNRPDLHLLLVGDGPARAGLEALARELGIASQLTITGVVQRSEMPDHIAAFDIALQPAVTDYASPLKLFEYMALAKPILAPASANICEVLKDKEDAALFAEQDGANFNNALDVLIADEGLRARLGAAARASLVRQDLTWAGNARRVEKIAQMLLDDRLTGDKV